VKITYVLGAGSESYLSYPVVAGDEIAVGDLGDLVFTPAANANGTNYAHLDFKVRDNGGIANGGVDLDQSANTLTFDVTSVNDAPQGTDATVTILEDGSHTFSAADFGFSDPNDSPANAFASVKITSVPAAGSLTYQSNPVGAGDEIPVGDLGDLVFTPAANANGTNYAHLDFKVRDNGGIANGGVDLDQSANTLTFDVTSVNDAPQGTDATVTILEDGSHTFSAADFGFSDPNDSPANAFASVKITSVPAAGSLTYQSNPVGAGDEIAVGDLGDLVFTPAANANGTNYAHLDFKVRDNGGIANGGVDLDQSANTLTFDVTSVNDAPQGTDATVTILEDGSHTFSAADFGFSDPNDSPANAFASVKITSVPAAGSLTYQSNPVGAGDEIAVGDLGDLVFTPAANANGTNYAHLDFKVRDNGGIANGGVDLDQSANTLTFDVTSVNDAPQGTDATVTILEDGSHTFSAADFGFSDPNDSPANAFASVKITSVPAAGSLTYQSNPVGAGDEIAVGDLGDLVFTPAANANGTNYAHLDFKVRDNGGIANG